MLLMSACVSRNRSGSIDAELPRLARTIADTVTTEIIAPGVRVHHLVSNAAPWRAEILEADLNACVSLRAIKGADVAVGRATTSALLKTMNGALNPIAAVNADFFSFAPPGVPVNAHVEQGLLISGPIDRPVFAITSAMRPWIGRLTVAGRLETSRGTVPLTTWNRPSANAVGLVDAHWGIKLDTAVVRTAWVLSPITTRRMTYVATPLLASRSSIVSGDTMLVVGVSPSDVASGALRTGDTVRVTRALAPITPLQVVGGQPQLLRDSMVSGAVDSVNNAAFRDLNPRTAIGYSHHGTRVLMAVIDGRQPKYSMGMTLRQMADLFRALGATDAINLDGGGSSAMVVTDSRTPTRTRAMNHPSDSAGERPVANALAVLRSCR